MVRTKIGYGLSGTLGAGIIVIGARFLVVPRAAAAAYGITSEQGSPTSDPYLAAKGVRDIASGVVAFVLLAAGKPHVLGRYFAAASIIPIGDAIIVLRGSGAKATAYGVHGTTAAVMLGTAALLFSGPESHSVGVGVGAGKRPRRGFSSGARVLLSAVRS